MHKNTMLAAVLVASLGAEAGGLPVTPEAAVAMDGAFRARYGDDVSVSFRADRAGASFLGGFRTERLADDPVAAAWRFVEREAGILGVVEPRVSLRVDRTVPHGNWTVVRFRQIASGLPVLRRGLVVVADAEGRVYQASGGLATFPSVEGSFEAGPAGAAAALRALVPSAAVESCEPAILAAAGRARFVYVSIVETGGVLDRFEVVQDGATGVPISARRLFVAARGNVLDPNPPEPLVPVAVDLPGLLSTTDLTGDRAVAWACGGVARCRPRMRRAVPDASGDYLYDPDDPSMTDPFAEVNAYYHIDRINRFFEDSIGYAWTCGGERAMHVQVNLDYANASFGDADRDGCGDVTLGQGEVIDFAYDADVIYHEFSHGIVDDTAGLWGWDADELGPDFSSGGINEGTADYFSVTFTDSATLGEYASHEGAMGELAIRDAVNRATCPQSLTGESHFDGTIWLGTTWEIRTAIGAEKTDAVVFSTLAALSEVADFDEAGRGLISAAERLATDGTLTAADVTEVERIVTERGLPGCVRIIDLSLGSGDAFSVGLAEVMWLDRLWAGVQFKLPTPTDAIRARIVITPITYLEPDAYDVYMRRNEPIHYTVGEMSIVLDGYDEVYTGSPETVAFNAWSTPPFEPGTTYYFTFVHRNPNAVMLSFQGEVVTAPPPADGGDGGEDAGPDVDATGDAGPDVDAESDAGPEDVEEVAADADDDVRIDAEPDDAAGPDADDAADVPGAGGGSGCDCRTARGRAPAGTLAALVSLLAVGCRPLVRNRKRRTTNNE